MEHDADYARYYAEYEREEAKTAAEDYTKHDDYADYPSHNSSGKRLIRGYLEPDFYEAHEQKRQEHRSVSHHYKHSSTNQDCMVAWLENSMDGPYAGRHDHLAKCDFTLQDDTAHPFFIFYNALRSHLSANNFHIELLPDLGFISPALDLKTTPVDHTDIPPIGKRKGIIKSQPYWQSEHKRLGRTLYAMFISRNILTKAPKQPVLNAPMKSMLMDSEFCSLCSLITIRDIIDP